MSTSARGDSSRRWRASYLVAIANAGVFWFGSLFGYFAAPDFIDLQRAVGALFALGSTISFYRLMMTGGLTAIAFFVLGVGLFFGFGVCYSTYVTEGGPLFQLFFSVSMQQEYLAKINFMNATSVLLVLLSAFPLCRVGPAGRSSYSIKMLFDIIYRYRIIVFGIAIVLLVAQYFTFPAPENLLLRGTLGKLHALVFLAIVLGIARWQTIGVSGKTITIILLAGACFLGFCSLAKSQVMMPIVALNAGLLMQRRSRLISVLVGLLTVVLYIYVVNPVVTIGRGDASYSDESATLLQRVSLITEIFQGKKTPVAGKEVKTRGTLVRFAVGPIQSFLVGQFDDGQPGDSLSDFWTTLVPRIIWPEKPNVTLWGADLYSLVFNVPNATSALGPTYTAEAYWNYGWLGVVIVSIVIGLEMGYLSRKWLNFISGADQKIGIVVFSVPIAYFAFLVETWIAASYAGGFVTLVILIGLCDALNVRFGRRSSARQVVEKVPVYHSMRDHPSKSLHYVK